MTEISLPSRWKSYALIALASISAIVLTITQCVNEDVPAPVLSPTATPTPTSVPSPIPTPTQSPTLSRVEVLDSLERPEYADASLWRKQAHRAILRGASTGFVLRTHVDACQIQADPMPGLFSLHVITRITIPRPSYKTGRVGDFYDPIIPLNLTTCKQAKYLWLEIETSAIKEVHVADATVYIDELSIEAPRIPSMPFYVGLHQNYLQAIPSIRAKLLR